MHSPLPFRPRSRDTEWLGGRFLFPYEISEGGERVRPEVILWLELPTPLIVGTKVHEPRKPATLAESLEETMRAPAAGSPRRPSRIRVATQELAEELAGIKVPVVVAPTPELDEVFLDFLASAGSANEPSYFGEGDIPPARAARLFDSAGVLYQLAPWTGVTEDQIMRVDIPRYGIRGACLAVIGDVGESFGLLLFSTIDDYLAAKGERHAAREDDDRVAMRSLSFDARDDIPPSLLREIEENRWRVVAAKAYPIWFCIDANLEPIPANDLDVRVMTAATSAFLAFYRVHRDLFAKESLTPVTFSSKDGDGAEVTITAPFAMDEQDMRGGPGPSMRNVGRNDPCPCGSGKKAKKCHLGADNAPRQKTEESVHVMDERLDD